MRLSRPATFALILVTLIGAAATAPANAATAPRIHGVDGPTVVPDSYIVVLKDHKRAADLTRAYGGTVRRAYSHALNGFEPEATAAQAERLAADPAVDYVQQNEVLKAIGTQANPPSWGLDRIPRPGWAPPVN